jgi:hypothetical protein
MPVEQGMIEEQGGGFLEQSFRRSPFLGQWLISQKGTDLSGRNSRSDRPLGQGLQKVREMIDNPVSQPAEFIGVHLQWRFSILKLFHLFQLDQSPSSLFSIGLP